ncbi:benzoylformate decarboxylase [Nonomuraea sp. NPDC046570]|uniref:benzoylformate decarboxylase n=1 Tax=Nonomuraea sp. NPDC046570 TaxID=3155255 RepID=UPI00340D513B
MSTVREVVVDWMRERGLTTVFGNPGSTELPMLKDFPAGFRYVLGLQEAVVVGMADGYAAVTGRPALVNLHTGPGVGNAMGAILGAAANRTPMIVTAGQQVRAMLTMEALLTNVAPTTLPQPAVKWAYEPPRPQDVPAALERAYHLAATPPRGPVFLSLPMDDFDAEAAPCPPRRVAGASTADPAELAALAERLDLAVSPVLVVGADADWDAAVELAERCALPVWEAPLEGRVAFPQDHPAYRGQLPPAIAPLSAELAGHDLVIVAGAPVFRYYPYVPGALLPEGAELVQLTCDPAEAARAACGDAIVGDVRQALRTLADLVKPTGRAAPEPRPGPAPAPPGRSPMSPVSALAALAQGAPPDTLWVNESPSNRPDFHDQIRMRRPGSFLFTAGGGLGYGLPAAVGARLGQPSRPVVAVVGDGSAQYAVPALWTAAAYRIPVTFVVLTNREYSILKWFGRLENAPGVPGLDIGGIDICSIARGYGVAASRAESFDALVEAVRAATASDAPHLIDVPVAPPS